MDLGDIKFTKPKKFSNYHLSKVSNCEIQFPKMEIISSDDKNIELEFVNDHSEIYNFLSKLDSYIVKYISEHSEEWFGKVIPINGVKQMYNKFIKAPRSSNNGCSMDFTFKKNCSLSDNNNNESYIGEFKENMKAECVSQLKYIYFSKDTCFTMWEIVSAKLYKQIKKVQAFGFVDDPDDICIEESEDDEIQTQTFF
jgi:hypothetical protein